MGIGSAVLNCILQAYQNDDFAQCKSVIDLGDQNLAVENIEIIDQFFKYRKISLDKINLDFLLKDKNHKSVSSSYFWKLNSFKICDRLDLFFSQRDIFEKTETRLINHDLNFSIKTKDMEQYDLVTDFGNNEHVFNVSETYKTMHNLTKINGFILIHQAIYNGNGFYNFSIDFFEHLAAANKYKIILSNIIITFKDGTFVYVNEQKNLSQNINFNEIDNISVVYVFKKQKDSFAVPYQRFSIENKKFYFESRINFNNYPFERYYVNKDLKHLKAKEILSELVSRILKKLRSYLKK